ncbi:MAG: ChaN family lipoprotein [Nitrospirota bacterium]
MLVVSGEMECCMVNKLLLFSHIVAVVLLFASGAAGAAQGTVPRAPESHPEYTLRVSFDIPESKLRGAAELAVGAGQQVILHTGALTITGLSLDQEKMDGAAKEGVLTLTAPRSGVLRIMYEGTFKERPVETASYGVVQSTISGEGISLTGAWYPQPEGLYVYRLTAILPHGYTALSEAERITTAARDGAVETAFDFPYPVDGISLVASKRYEVTEDRYKGVRLYAYFFPEERELAKRYIEFTKNYLARYEELLGPFPYKRFAVVENFLPTGYSMPTFTLLGRDVVKLPFIVETSLGHEILHQWFGNYVYIAFDKGNWAEGLTTYLADHAFEEGKGKGADYRKQLLIDYASYVDEENEVPLKEFRGRSDFASKAIGYGKAALVFHMLKRELGEEVFYRSLRELIAEKAFARASWDDIRRVFERGYEGELDRFFEEWVETPGLPRLEARTSGVKQRGDKYEVTVTVGQENGRKGAPYTLDVPVFFHYPDGSVEEELIGIDSQKETAAFTLDRMPERIVMDERYDLARALTPEETPPVIARLIGAGKPLIVLPEDGAERYAPVIEHFRAEGGIEKKAAELKDAEVKRSTLVVLGSESPLVQRLFGKMEPAGGFTVSVRENPWNEQQVIGIFDATSRDEVEAGFRKVFHYGKYSMLAFDKGKNIAKRIEESAQGIAVWEREQTTAVAVDAIRTLPAVIDAVAGKKIVYVGEYHDRFAHHQVQLEIIKGLYERNKKLAIGMEMFQRPYQKALDEFIAGTIDEREFLKKSEYFKRWSFDYNLYRPILSFAREKGIPVVALNIQRELTEKVSKGGLDALSDEERKAVPERFDFSDEEYRERLEAAFRMHGHGGNERSFDYFYQSQVLWDETMAASIDEFFRSNRDFEQEGRMVVIAGSGHLAHGSGIPKRTFRRNGYPYAIVLNDTEVEKGIADYLVFPARLEAVPAPKIMATLEEEQGRVSIKAFPEQSVSQEAGLRVGDRIAALDGIPVSSVDDIRIHLLYKKKGEPLKVTVVRKRFLRGDRLMEFTVML